MFLKCSKLIILIILNFGQTTNSAGIDYRKGTCPSLTSTSTTSVRCLKNSRLLTNCENPTDGTIVAVSCISAEYSLHEYTFPVCRNGQWSSSIPQCYPINDGILYDAFGPSNISSPQTTPYSSCSSLTSSTSTNFKCKHEGKSLKNCKNPIDGTTVLILCNPFYEESSLQISPIRLCRNGKWSSNIPECYPNRYAVPSTTSEKSYPSLGGQTSIYNRVCPSLISNDSTSFQCLHNNIPLNNCENAIDGTIVIISCNTFYEESSLENNPTRTCRNGEWDSAIPQCYPICGKAPATVLGTFNSSLGSKNAPHNYPWHVGIYSTTRKYLCGGTIIINSKTILTAAHCVTDDNAKLKHPSNYLVVAGKHYLNYADTRDEYAQYARVHEIHIPRGYKGYKTYWSYDLAVLILKKPFVLSVAVQPVCLELNKEPENWNTLVNNTGIVTGWGHINEGGPRSEVLKELIIPYVPFSECYQEVQESWRIFVKIDKVCGGYIQNEGNICREDGGGGFIFKNVIDDRYYIEAILSVGLFNKLSECYSNQYSVYTSIVYYIQFLKSVITT